MQERLGIAGSGAIACGLAVAAAEHDEVLLWARSEDSAERARARVAKMCEKLNGFDADRIRVVTDLDALADATFLVEAVIEHHGSKSRGAGRPRGARPARRRRRRAGHHDVVAVDRRAGARERAPRAASSACIRSTRCRGCELVELAFPAEASDETRRRARALCEALGKTPVEVPDIPGFVVNRLLFPYLFSAVELLAETGMTPDDIDNCMTLGAGMPMGPIALLDYVGLDVSQAIGEAIGARVPDRLLALVEEGSLGRKTGRGFYNYR